MDERLNVAPCGYVSITHEGIVTDVNQTFLDKMGYKRDDLVQKHFESIMTTANKLVFHSYFYPFINLNGQVEELELIYEEIERKQQELMQLNHILVELSVTDKLTGLKNRRFLQDKLEENISTFHVSKQPFSILMIDIDHFKLVNDTWGHQTGDEVLEHLANILRSESRIEDIVSRYGGEEFMLILPGIDVLESERIAEHLRQAVEISSWTTGRITVSIGIATMSAEDSDDSLLKKADQALYASKENGRNQVTHSLNMKQKLL